MSAKTLEKEAEMLILFLGRSIDGIRKDAEMAFPGEEILVVTRVGDQLQPPAGLATVPVDEFQPQPGAQYTVIANGGTAVQLVSVLKALVQAGAPLKVYDLQRDGMTQLW